MWRVSVFVIILLLVLCSNAVKYGVVGKIAIGFYLIAAIISIPAIWSWVKKKSKLKVKNVYQIGLVGLLSIIGVLIVEYQTRLPVTTPLKQTASVNQPIDTLSVTKNTILTSTSPLPDSELSELEETTIVDKEKIVELKNLEKAIGKTKADTELYSKDGIELYVGVMNEAAVRASVAKTSENKEVLEAANQLEETIKKRQLGDLPLLRKKWAMLFKKAMREQNVQVTISGKRNTILLISGSVYADDEEIKRTQEMLSASLELLRFKQVKYKSHTYDSYTTYYVQSAYDAILLNQ